MWHQRLIRSQKFYYIFVVVDLFLYIRLLRFAISVSRFYPPKRKKSKFMKISFISKKLLKNVIKKLEHSTRGRRWIYPKKILLRTLPMIMRSSASHHVQVHQSKMLLQNASTGTMLNQFGYGISGCSSEKSMNWGIFHGNISQLIDYELLDCRWIAYI